MVGLSDDVGPLNVANFPKMGVSNRWSGIWNGAVEWKMEWNSECTQL